jgi:hypothetical protein
MKKGQKEEEEEEIEGFFRSSINFSTEIKQT